MTISTTINRKEYVGDGSSTSFSFPYFVIAAADLKVYQNGTLKTITTHYTLSGSAPYSSGTNVLFLSAPALDDEIVIIRDPAITQAVDLVDNDPLPAASIETPLDRLTMIAQRLGERIDRSFTLADTDVSGASTELPTPAASKLIGWDSAGTALANYASASIVDTIVPTAFMETLLDDTSAATARTTLGAGDFKADGTVPMTGDLVFGAGKGVIFEGTTADAFETTLLAGEPTADRTINLPDGSGTLAFTASASNALAGSVVQVVNTQTGAVSTGTTTIPLDDTIPQNTEGDQYMTLAVTPTSATNKLRITVVAVAANDVAGGTLIAALFQDSTANALAAVSQGFSDANNRGVNLKLEHYMTAGTTSATTFKVRIGCSAAGTTTFNGRNGARLFGGVAASSITIEEIKV